MKKSEKEREGERVKKLRTIEGHSIEGFDSFQPLSPFNAGE